MNERNRLPLPGCVAHGGEHMEILVLYFRLLGICAFDSLNTLHMGCFAGLGTVMIRKYLIPVFMKLAISSMSLWEVK